MEQNRRKSSL